MGEKGNGIVRRKWGVMTKAELDDRAKAILKSDVPRSLRNNMVLANTEDLSRILGITLSEVQEKYGRWDTYTLEVVKETESGYLLRFPDKQEIRMGWEK